VAGVQTYLRNLALRVAYDATEVARGVDQTEADLESLERTTSSTADSIDRAFSDVGDSAATTFDRGGDFDTALTNAEGTATSRGAAIGEGVSQGLTEGIETGDWSGAITNTLQSISGALPGIGAAVAIGASIAGSIMFGMKRAADAKRQEFVDAVNEGFREIEVAAGQSTRAINKALLARLSFAKTVADLGGGDEDAGFRKASEWARILGVNIEDVINKINGQMTPGTIALTERMKELTAELANSGAEIREANGVMSGTQQIAAEINRLTLEQNKIRGDLLPKLHAEGRAAEDIANFNERAAAAAGRMADAATRYTAAIVTASGRRLPTDIAP
jgi:hypothetical protein